MDSKAFYDKYADRQIAVGVNARHQAILKWLRRFGLRPGMRVLEIGCGVGTLTGLLAAELGGQGSLVGVDISPRSIEAARQRLASFRDAELLVGDVLAVDVQGDFDVVVLPDVIEHIPLGQHAALFHKVSMWVRPNGFVLLHYPNPRFLEWCHIHRPDLLQQIDQPIHADTLLTNAHGAGLLLHHLETYSIWVAENDYQVAVLRPRREPMSFTLVPEGPSFASRIRARIRSIVK